MIDPEIAAIETKLAQELNIEIVRCPTPKPKTKLTISLFDQGSHFSEETPGYIKHDVAMKMWRKLVKTRALQNRLVKELSRLHDNPLLESAPETCAICSLLLEAREP